MSTSLATLQQTGNLERNLSQNLHGDPNGTLNSGLNSNMNSNFNSSLSGSQRDGFVSNDNFISYFQVEYALLEYPQVVEAGVIAVGENNQQSLKVYIALDGKLEDEECVNYCQEVKNYIRSRFRIGLPVKVQIREKLPMTRSGKILRTVLLEWN
ncbi:MAG: hypothetical protein M0T74_18560 [Desulfitobacterium hafniense]|nr:hypothetical protein [Desulfitobacterium hafniense]